MTSTERSPSSRTDLLASSQITIKPSYKDPFIYNANSLFDIPKYKGTLVKHFIKVTMQTPAAPVTVRNLQELAFRTIKNIYLLQDGKVVKTIDMLFLISQFDNLLEDTYTKVESGVAVTGSELSAGLEVVRYFPTFLGQLDIPYDKVTTLQIVSTENRDTMGTSVNLIKLDFELLCFFELGLAGTVLDTKTSFSEKPIPFSATQTSVEFVVQCLEKVDGIRLMAQTTDSKKAKITRFTVEINGIVKFDIDEVYNYDPFNRTMGYNVGSTLVYKFRELNLRSIYPVKIRVFFISPVAAGNVFLTLDVV